MSRPFQVNFLILGAQKSGTTALAHFLAQHPDICLPPVKEVHLFDYAEWSWMDWSRASVLRRYRPYFPNFTGQRWVGEATPEYLLLPWVPGLLHHFNPELKLIVLLREPGERALSHFRHARRDGSAKLPFPLELLRERVLLRRGLGPVASRQAAYLERSRYVPQLRRLLRYFAPSQVLVLTREALARRHEETLAAVYRFLDLPRTGVYPRAEQQNVSVSGRDTVGERLGRRLVSVWLARERPALEKMLGVDLSDWGGAPFSEHRPRAGIGRRGRDLESSIRDRFAAVLGRKRVAAADDFFALGGGLGQAELFARGSEEALGRAVFARALVRNPSPRLLSAALEAEHQGGGGEKRGGPAPRLFVVGRSASLLRGLHRRRLRTASAAVTVIPLCVDVDVDVDVGATEASGAVPVGELFERVLEHQPEGPWHILGEGEAATTAVALALRLSENRRHPIRLALLEPVPPPPGMRAAAPLPGEIAVLLGALGSPPPLADRRLDWHRFAERGLRVVSLSFMTGGLDRPEHAGVIDRVLARMVSGRMPGVSLADYRKATPRLRAPAASGPSELLLPSGLSIPLTRTADGVAGKIAHAARDGARIRLDLRAARTAGRFLELVALFLGDELLLLERLPRTGDPERDGRLELEVTLNDMGHEATGPLRVVRVETGLSGGVAITAEAVQSTNAENQEQQSEATR